MVLSLSAGTAQGQDFVSPPAAEPITAGDGFGSRTINVQSGPAENEAPLTASCGGAISHVAQAHFFYTAGAHELVIAAAGQSPVSLLIADPQGNWHCEAGGAEAPNVVFAPALSGRYAIWVGAIGNGGAAVVSVEERDKPRAGEN
jgi:hypothetical protein